MNAVDGTPSAIQDFVSYFGELSDGLGVSLMLCGLSLAIGLPSALVLALGVMGPSRTARWASTLFVEFGRGAPALVLLQMMYFGLPSTGITLPALLSAVFALSWTTAAYSAEYIRGGMAAVPQGEIEGCQALGMTPRDALRFVRIPQGLRIALPSLMGFAVMLFHATSLGYTVAVPELMSRAHSIGSTNFRYMNILLAAGCLYALVSIPCTWFSVLMESRMNRHA